MISHGSHLLLTMRIFVAMFSMQEKIETTIKKIIFCGATVSRKENTFF
jgi:hypothetical protein